MWPIGKQTRTEPLKFPEEGGVSGAPLQKTSENFLKKAINLLGAERKGKLIVSAGGVLTPEDVAHRLEIGADLVQTYSGLVFRGPLFFNDLSRYFST